MKKVKSGDKFQAPASTWNSFIDAAQYVQDRRTGITATVRDVKKRMVSVKVYNADEEALNIFTPVSLTEPMIPIVDVSGALQFANEMPVLNAKNYESSDDGIVGIMQDTVASGKIGSAVIAGVTPALLETDIPATIIWRQEPWAIVYLGSGSVYSGPFKIVEDEFGFYVESGIDPDDVLAGYALFNGEMIEVDAGMVLSDGPGYVCLVIEETDADPFAYFDILEMPEGEDGQAVYPLGYIEQDEETGTYTIHQFHHAMPQLWLVGYCEDDEEETDGEEEPDE